MSYIPNKAMPHAAKHKRTASSKPRLQQALADVRRLFGSRTAKLGLLGAAAVAVVLPFALARSTAKR